MLIHFDVFIFSLPIVNASERAHTAISDAHKTVPAT